MQETKSLNFHYGFQPELQYISEILELANCGFIGTKEEIMEKTGIPTGTSSGKVVPAIKYAEYMGLIESTINKSKYNFKLTKIGEIILNEDKYLRDNITKLILHYHIIDRQIGAEQWSYMFKTINNEIGQTYNMKLFNQRSKIDYLISKIDFKPVINSYKNENCFKELNLIEFDNEEIRFKKNTVDYDLIAIYSYILLDLWKRYFNERIEITIDELVDELEIGKIFGFDREEILYMLDEIETDGAIRVNKQLSPILIQKLTEQDEYLDRLYESAI